MLNHPQKSFLFTLDKTAGSNVNRNLLRIDTFLTKKILLCYWLHYHCYCLDRDAQMLYNRRATQLDWFCFHYNDVIMTTMVSQISSLTIVYSTVYPGSDERKHQSSASLAFVSGIHQWPVDSPRKGPVMRKMFPFDDVIMLALKTAVAKATLKNIGKNNAEIYQLLSNWWITVLFLPIFVRVDLQALGQSHACTSASEVTLKDIGRYWTAVKDKNQK